MAHIIAAKCGPWQVLVAADETGAPTVSHGPIDGEMSPWTTPAEALVEITEDAAPGAHLPPLVRFVLEHT